MKLFTATDMKRGVYDLAIGLIIAIAAGACILEIWRRYGIGAAMIALVVAFMLFIAGLPERTRSIKPLKPIPRQRCEPPSFH